MDTPADTPSDPALEGLWRNCSDSFAHALSHFAALDEDDSFHNRKWAILSVHHAGEVFGNWLLSRLDPKHPKPTRKGRRDYPSLRRLTEALPRHPRWLDLTRGERRLFEEFLPPICDCRNRLMHGPAQPQPDVSASAIALLGLLHVLRRRTGVSVPQLYDQSPPVQGNVFAAIDWRQFDRYNSLIEDLVAEYYPLGLVDYCPSCGAKARTFGVDCEACFTEDAWRIDSK